MNKKKKIFGWLVLALVVLILGLVALDFYIGKSTDRDMLLKQGEGMKPIIDRLCSDFKKYDIYTVEACHKGAYTLYFKTSSSKKSEEGSDLLTLFNTSGVPICSTGSVIDFQVSSACDDLFKNLDCQWRSFCKQDAKGEIIIYP